MASESDRWLFLLTMASIPLGCGDDTSVVTDGSTGQPATGTTGAPVGSSGAASTDDGVTGSGATSLDGTTGSSAGSSSEGTTTAVDPGTTSSTGATSPESSSDSSSTGSPLGMCELWATEWVACYGYYTIPYLTAYCYDTLSYVDPMCTADAEAFYLCEALGGGPCMAACDVAYDAWQSCEDQVLADMLGCNMLPMVPAVGTIESQCTDLSNVARACDTAGYYISGFSQYVAYPPEYMVDFCVGGAYFTFPPPPLAPGDTCGGAYEDLLTCVSMLSCSDLELAVFFPSMFCPVEDDSLTCRCELGA